jgi:membrane-bound lytic murein transglycosylase D
VTQLWPWKQDPASVASELTQPFPPLPGFSPKAARDNTNPADFDFDRREVAGYVDRFQTDLRGFYGRALERSGRYVSFMETILEQQGVPADLVYLPLIESGFQTGAVSRAGAVGPWQFIRQTGRRYGLRIDQYVDERRDPVKSTEAAARYLRDLYDMFNDWHLSLAAYNTGEGNIARVLERRGADDYWDMRKRGYIVRETREYVPRFLAALQIARSPETYGFPAPEDEPLTFDWVRVSRPLTLTRIAELCGTSVADIRELNPALTRGVVPQNGYTVRIPKGMKRSFMQAIAELPPPAAYAASKPSRRQCSGMQDDGTYCLRSGETIGAVAERYGVSAQALLKANDIRDPRRVSVGQVLAIPGYRSAASSKRHVSSSGAFERTAGSTHRVRAGETLGAIAARYGMTPSVLARANGMRNVNRLKVGQLLEIPGRQRTTAAPKVAAAAPKGASEPVAKAPRRSEPVAKVPAITDPPRRSTKRAHTVRSGESPYAIAQRYGVDLDDLLEANGVRDARRIQVGRTLVIPGSTATVAAAPAAAKAAAPPRANSHKVSSGETLATIAARYGVSTQQLLQANGIRDARRLQVGQTLTIPSKTSGGQVVRTSNATHTVRNGDTLYSIARRYGVSLDALLSANGIKNARSIRPGQTLRIPQQVAAK